MTSPRSISICSDLLAESRSNGICLASCSIACLLYHCSCVSDMMWMIALWKYTFCRYLSHVPYNNRNMQIGNDSSLAIVSSSYPLQHVYFQEDSHFALDCRGVT